MYHVWRSYLKWFSEYRVYKVLQQCVTCDLDLWPLTLKNKRVRPLVISSKCTKFDGPRWNGSVCILFTSFVDRRTDQTPVPYHNRYRQVGRIKTMSSDYWSTAIIIHLPVHHQFSTEIDLKLVLSYPFIHFHHLEWHFLHIGNFQLHRETCAIVIQCKQLVSLLKLWHTYRTMMAVLLNTVHSSKHFEQVSLLTWYS